MADNSIRENQVLSATQITEKPEGVSLGPWPQIRVTNGKTSKFRMGFETLFVTVNKDDKGIYRSLCQSRQGQRLSKPVGCHLQGSFNCPEIEIDPKVIIDQLSRIRCLSTAVARKANKGVDVFSCPDAVAQVLEKALGLSDTAGNHQFIKKIPRLWPDSAF